MSFETFIPTLLLPISGCVVLQGITLLAPRELDLVGPDLGDSILDLTFRNLFSKEFSAADFSVLTKVKNPFLYFLNRRDFILLKGFERFARNLGNQYIYKNLTAECNRDLFYRPSTWNLERTGKYELETYMDDARNDFDSLDFFTYISYLSPGQQSALSS